MSVEWKNGYSATYYATFVDPRSWADQEQIKLTGGSIQRAASELLESADLDCRNYNQSQERWIRVWLDVKQGSSYSHTALFTGLATSPGRSINGTIESQKVQCYSVLKPAQDILLDRGYYAPLGTDGAYLIKDLLSCLNAPVDISKISSENSSLTQAIVAENGENHLSMTSKVLYSMNWRIKISGLGVVSVEPYVKEPVVYFDSIDNDMVEPSLSVNFDWYDCPNVVRAVMDDQVSVAKDENENSPLSIANRGREVWYEETNCVLNDKESLQGFAERRLQELQRVSTSISYDRRYHPDIYPTDVVGLNFPRQNISGLYMVSSQTIDLGFSAKTSEEVLKL